MKTLALAVAVLLLAAVLAACGGGDDSSSTATDVAAGQPESKSGDGSSSNGKAETGGDKKSPGGGEASGESSGDFVPKPHDDSGGGSEQFRVKGGDNSVQEFGGEADRSELDAAAAALHNFLDARAAGDWAAACGYLTESVIESLAKLATQAKQGADTSCAGTLATLTNPAAMGVLRTEAAQADVGSLRIEGDRAFIIYTGLKGTIFAMPMENEGGSWKVATLAGTPLS